MTSFLMERVILSAMILLAAGSALGQTPHPLAKPEDLGLMVPSGRRAFEVADKNVLVPAEGDGEDLVVAKVYLEVGDRYIVMLPNGALRSVLKRDTTLTEREFQSATKDEIAEELLKQFKGFKTRSTRRYLCVYNTSDSFCERKTAILETMYPMLLSYFKRQRLPIHTPDTPLIVVMFRSREDFQKYRQMPESLLAYYNAVSNRVFLYQYSDIMKDAPTIAVKQSTSTIAHEGVHQILHNIGVQKRLSSWPLWISEGLAEYFSPTTSTSRSKWSGVGKPNDLRMRDLFRFLKGANSLGSGSLVQHIVTTQRLSPTEYSIAWALTHYLATRRRQDFFDYLRDVSSTAPLSESTDELVRFTNYFGANFAKVEREMIKHIRGLPYRDPVANQPFFLVTAQSGKRKLATITSSLDLKKVKNGLLAKMTPAERLKARFGVRTFPNRNLAHQAMLLFTR